ncbi:MAG: hypothetical protein LBO21_08490 [Synergistaceae bacterium]|jgi:hypothetical protein|nr:hypothetical protein [Synergistaceae bacterium]
MPTTQTATREDLFSRINRLSDNELARVVELVDSIEGHEPNEETIAALRESADMQNLIGPFHNMEDFMASLLNDDDA